MVMHAHLKNEFTEDEKYHNLLHDRAHLKTARSSFRIPLCFGVPTLDFGVNFTAFEFRKLL